VAGPAVGGFPVQRRRKAAAAKKTSKRAMEARVDKNLRKTQARELRVVIKRRRTKT
jgi:hypothetical protein